MDEALRKSGDYPNIALTPGTHRHAATGEPVKIPASARMDGGACDIPFCEQVDRWLHGDAPSECRECADGKYGELTAMVGGGKPTADDVRDIIEHNSYHVSGNTREFFNGAYEAIADELNATLGRGECEIETKENWLPAEQYHRCKHCGAFFAVMNATGDIPPCVCPNCGKAVKR